MPTLECFFSFYFILCFLLFACLSRCPIATSSSIIGYDYNRLLVDTLKAPLVFAQPWDGKKMMKLPSHRAYALFKGHESELDRIEGKKKSSSTSSTSSTFSTSSGADSESFLSTLFSRATPTYTLSTSPTPRPLEVDTFQMAEPMAWALVQKQVIDTELGLMTAGSNIATTTTTAAAASTSTAGAEHSDVIARYSTTSFKVSSSKVTPSSSTTASSSSAAAAATAGGARGSGAASAATSSSSSSSAASGGDAALFDFQFQHVTSRRVYMPGYVTEYSHMGKYWRVFISGVTGTYSDAPLSAVYDHDAAVMLIPTVIGMLGSCCGEAMLPRVYFIIGVSSCQPSLASSPSLQVRSLVCSSWVCSPSTSSRSACPLTRRSRALRLFP